MEEKDKYELVRQAILSWMIDYKRKRNEDYELNGEQAEKMNYIIAACQDLEKMFPNQIKIHDVMVEPKYEQGVVWLEVNDDLILGEKANSLETFREIVNRCDGMNIQPFTDEDFFIEFFVDHVHVKIKSE